LAHRKLPRSPSSHRCVKETRADQLAARAPELGATQPMAMGRAEKPNMNNAIGKMFWDSAVAGFLGPAESTRPTFSAEEEEKILEKAFQQVFLPRKVDRLQEQINLLNLKHTPVLTEHEKKVWDVIRRGSRGAEYCQELHAAGVRPRRSWKDCPGTYPAAYLDCRWRQRINDEKSKIRRKAELAEQARLVG